LAFGPLFSLLMSLGPLYTFTEPTVLSHSLFLFQ